MTTKPVEVVELRCPTCSGDRIVEWSEVPASQEISGVFLNDDTGDYQVGEWEASEACWEAGESMGFACLNCGAGEYRQLKDFVVVKPAAESIYDSATFDGGELLDGLLDG